jgi:hypothetical protein
LDLPVATGISLSRAGPPASASTGQGANPPDQTGFVNRSAASSATEACPGGRLDVQAYQYWYYSTTGRDSSYPNSNFDGWMVAQALPLRQAPWIPGRLGFP